MTGTAAELTPVREIDDHPVGPASRARSRARSRRVFEDALHGRAERYARLARRGAGARADAR